MQTKKWVFAHVSQNLKMSFKKVRKIRKISKMLDFLGENSRFKDKLQIK